MNDMRIEDFLNFPVEIEPFNTLLPLEQIIHEVTSLPIKTVCYLLEGKDLIDE